MGKPDVGEKRIFKRTDIEWNQIREALTTDWHKTVLRFAALFCNALNGDTVYMFIPLIIKQFVVLKDNKLTDVQSNECSLLYSMIPDAIKSGGCTIILILSLMGVFMCWRSFYILVFSALTLRLHL